MTAPAAFLYSIASLRHLLAEQSTPADVANFIVLCVGLIVFASAAVYVVVMRLLWSSLPHGKNKFASVFVDLGNFREWLGETLIVACTGLLLIYTFHVRHTIVERIANAPSHSLVVEMAQRGLVGSGDTTSLVRSGAAAEAILKPLVSTGSAADALAIADQMISWPGADETSVARAKKVLMWGAVGLLLLYLGWQLNLRYGQLRVAFAAGKDAQSDYQEAIKRLATIAVCIALLLAAAAPMDDKQHLTESVLSAMKGRTLATPQDAKIAEQVTQTLQQTDAGLRHSADSALSRLTRDYRVASESLAALRKQLSQLEVGSQGRDAALASMQSQVDQLSTRSGETTTLATRVKTLEARADSGAIVVFADPKIQYLISNSAKQVVRGAGTAAYRVPSDTYTLSVANSKGEPVIVRRGDVQIRCVTIESAPVQAGSPQTGAVGGRGGAKAAMVAAPSALVPGVCRGRVG